MCGKNLSLALCNCKIFNISGIQKVVILEYFRNFIELAFVKTAISVRFKDFYYFSVHLRAKYIQIG